MWGDRFVWGDDLDDSVVWGDRLVWGDLADLAVQSVGQSISDVDWQVNDITVLIRDVN